MTSLDDSIMDYLKKGWISGDDAYSKCVDKEKFKPYVSELLTDFTEV